MPIINRAYVQQGDDFLRLLPCRPQDYSSGYRRDALPFIADELMDTRMGSSMMFGAASGPSARLALSSWDVKEPDDWRDPLRRRFPLLCRRP